MVALARKDDVTAMLFGEGEEYLVKLGLLEAWSVLPS
jgi:hypothetical protein